MNEKGCILVSGGLGYIGSHTVVALLEQGYEVVIVDNLSNSRRDILRLIKRLTGTEPAFYEVDCADRTAMAKVFDDVFAIDGIIHFAAHKAVGESVQKPLLMHCLPCENLHRRSGYRISFFRVRLPSMARQSNCL